MRSRHLPPTALILGLTCADDPRHDLPSSAYVATADNAYFPGTPATALRWDPYGERWTLTTRTFPKEGGQWVQSMVAPLGELATEGTPDRPWFVGYILDEYSPRPVLVWSVGRESFQFEGQFEDM